MKIGEAVAVAEALQGHDSGATVTIVFSPDDGVQLAALALKSVDQRPLLEEICRLGRLHDLEVRLAPADSQKATLVRLGRWSS